MAKTNISERLPRSAEELEELADYYSTHDTSEEMEDGQWVEPKPMVTTSLRLPADLLETLKQEARKHGIRYTALVRRLLEEYARGEQGDASRDEIVTRLDRIERMLHERPHAQSRNVVPMEARPSGTAKKTTTRKAAAKKSAAKKTAKRSAKKAPHRVAAKKSRASGH